MIEAVIFDMDGLLIDSEPLWQEAEMEIFNKLNVPLTQEMTLETTGLRSDEVVQYWFKRYPWGESPAEKEVDDLLNDTVTEIIRARGVGMPGVNQAIAICEAAGLPIAIASASPYILIHAALEKLGIADKITLVHSAHDEDYGKPHPAVYISTARQLEVNPHHCLAFEDSVNGVLSAKAARMKCIAVPDPKIYDDKRYGIADTILHSLKDFTPEMLKNW